MVTLAQPIWLLQRCSVDRRSLCEMYLNSNNRNKEKMHDKQFEQGSPYRYRRSGHPGKRSLVRLAFRV